MTCARSQDITIYVRAVSEPTLDRFTRSLAHSTRIRMLMFCNDTIHRPSKIGSRIVRFLFFSMRKVKLSRLSVKFFISRNSTVGSRRGLKRGRRLLPDQAGVFSGGNDVDDVTDVAEDRSPQSLSSLAFCN